MNSAAVLNSIRLLKAKRHHTREDTRALGLLTRRWNKFTAIEQQQARRMTMTEDFNTEQLFESRVKQSAIFQFFAYEHLPAPLQTVSKPFGDIAALVIDTLPNNPERTVCLRKLLEAKDCAVRTLLVQS